MTNPNFRETFMSFFATTYKESSIRHHPESSCPHSKLKSAKKCNLGKPKAKIKSFEKTSKGFEQWATVSTQNKRQSKGL